MEKIGELLRGAQKEITKMVVEALLEDGFTVETEGLSIQVKDAYGNPMLQITFTGKFKVQHSKEEL
jgi:hypothetical protein